MPQFRITCRAALDEKVIANLDAEGIYWYGGFSQSGWAASSDATI